MRVGENWLTDWALRKGGRMIEKIISEILKLLGIVKPEPAYVKASK